MSRITLSKPAAQKAIKYSKEAYEKLTANANVMNKRVNSQFVGLKDPAYIRYLELSAQMQDLIGQIGRKMDSVSEYCEAMMRWIDTYNER